MKRKTESLSEHTWLQIGGPAEIAVPESKDELINLLVQCSQNKRSYRILGNGSNLLVDDNGVDELVIKTTHANTEIEIEGNHVYAGASVLLPKFVTICVNNELGGHEYLYSVPGTIGGAIYMNAGRGSIHNETISDYVTSIEIFDGERVRTVASNEITFKHRYSTFQEHSDWVILSAEFEFPSQPAEQGKEKIKSRLEYIQERERSLPNAGSVFKSDASLPLHRIPPNGLKTGDARFVAANRICNDGGANSKEVTRLIKIAQLIHRIVPPFKSPTVEYEIWK